MDSQRSNLSPERIAVLAGQRVFPAERLLQILHDSGIILYDEHGAAAAPLALFQQGENGHLTLTFLSRESVMTLEYVIGERNSRGEAEWTLIRFLRKEGAVAEVELRIEEECAHFHYEFAPREALRLVCSPAQLAELEIDAVVRRLMIGPAHSVATVWASLDELPRRTSGQVIPGR